MSRLPPLPSSTGQSPREQLGRHKPLKLVDTNGIAVLNVSNDVKHYEPRGRLHAVPLKRAPVTVQLQVVRSSDDTLPAGQSRQRLAATPLPCLKVPDGHRVHAASNSYCPAGQSSTR